MTEIYKTLMVKTVLVHSSQQQLEESSGQPEKTSESTKVLGTFWNNVIKIVKETVNETAWTNIHADLIKLLDWQQEKRLRNKLRKILVIRKYAKVEEAQLMMAINTEVSKITTKIQVDVILRMIMIMINHYDDVVYDPVQ